MRDELGESSFGGGLLVVMGRGLGRGGGWLYDLVTMKEVYLEVVID
jgi:hypothetical protein